MIRYDVFMVWYGVGSGWARTALGARSHGGEPGTLGSVQDGFILYSFVKLLAVPLYGMVLYDMAWY